MPALDWIGIAGVMLPPRFIRAEKLPAERNSHAARTPQQAIVPYVIPMEGNKLRASVYAPIARAANTALIEAIVPDAPHHRHKGCPASGTTTKKGRIGAMILPTMAIRKSSGIRTAHLSTQLSISTPAKSIRVLRVGA